MILSEDLQAPYEAMKPHLKELEYVVKDLLVSLAGKVGGHLRTTRVKSLESIVAKTEKDSIRAPFKEMDDLVAATVTFRTREQMSGFSEQITEYCELVEEKSPQQNDPERFNYGDRRMILRLRRDFNKALDNPTLSEIKFEVQLKTPLEEALTEWSHQVYKTPNLSWEQARIVSQTRAIVEMADSALARLQDTPLERELVEFETYARRNKIIELVKSKLDSTQLPVDLRRLAITIDHDLTQYYENRLQRVSEFEKLLNDARNVDVLTASSLTAYDVIIILFVRAGKTTRRGNGKLHLKSRQAILVTNEMISFCPELKDLDSESTVDLGIPTSLIDIPQSASFNEKLGN